jgi:DNA-binding beta-propeller fold protein YncE
VEAELETRNRIAVTPDGREVWVGSNEAGTVTVIETASGSVVKLLPGLGFPYRVGMSPDGRHALVCDPGQGRLHIADVATRSVIGGVVGFGSPRGVIVAGDNRTAYVTVAEGAVVSVDLVERRVLDRWTVGASPDGISWGPRP